MLNTSQPELDASLLVPFISASPDGASRIKVETEETTPHFTRIATEVQYPTSLDPLDFFSALGLPVRSIDHPVYELLLLARPGGQLEPFEAVERFRGVIRGLGYRATSATEVQGEAIVTKTEFTYPSVESLNTTSERLFPSMPLRFKEFAGGKFDAEDFLRSFVEDSEVLVATEQPWALHDHAARHLLGYLALGEEFVDRIREVSGQYLTRLAGERALPPVPLTEESEKGFLHPSRLAIGGILAKLDGLSTDIPNHILHDEIPQLGDINGRTTRLFDYFWEDGSSTGSRRDVPRGFLGGSSRELDQRCASEVWRRYESAEANALALASK